MTFPATPPYERRNAPSRRRPGPPAAREAWRLATEITGDDTLGLHMAESLSAGALDLLEYAFRSSSTVATGMERLARYGRVTNDRAAARVESTGAGLRLVLGDPRAEPIQPQRADFHRSFKRWTGKTPLSWRRALRAA